MGTQARSRAWRRWGSRCCSDGELLAGEGRGGRFRVDGFSGKSCAGLTV